MNIKKQPPGFAFAKPFLPILAYALVLKASLVVLLTVVTSSLLMKDTASNIDQSVDFVSKHYILLAYGIAALCIFLLWHYGALALSSNKCHTRERKVWIFELSFWRDMVMGAAQAIIFLTILLTPLVVFGQVGFHGASILSYTRSLLFLVFLQNCFALFILVFCEEYIFRAKLLSSLMKKSNITIALLLSSLFYIIIKHLQFQFSWQETISLFCLSSIAGLFFIRTRNIFLGASFLASFYGFFHFVLGFKLWGREDQSILLFQYAKNGIHVLTGQSAGPLAGLSFMICLFMILCTEYYLTIADRRNSDEEGIVV